MDYVKTEQLYKEIGRKKFKETADYNRYRKEQKWKTDVKSRRTGEYYQANELIRRDLVLKKGHRHMLTKKGTIRISIEIC